MLSACLAIIIIPLVFSPITKHWRRRRGLASCVYRLIYRSLNIQLITYGKPTHEPALWVCNHISWLDVLLLAGNNTVDFIAKSEVAQWPIIGPLVAKTGTVLINRENKFQAYRSIPVLQKRIRSGTSVIVFPEGTTTSGKHTLPFKPMFYQAAIRENTLVQPVSIQYFNEYGTQTHSVAFIDDDDFSTSLKRILKEKSITAHLHYLPAMKASDYHRKILAKHNQQAVNLRIQTQTSD